jgi:hypothetical protein
MVRTIDFTAPAPRSASSGAVEELTSPSSTTRSILEATLW